MSTYTPTPIDTTEIHLPQELADLVEKIAEHVHERWAQERIRQGWTYGPSRDDMKLEHPSLVPYATLPESEKLIDRSTATESLKAALKLGWKIEH